MGPVSCEGGLRAGLDHTGTGPHHLGRDRYLELRIGPLFHHTEHVDRKRLVCRMLDALQEDAIELLPPMPEHTALRVPPCDQRIPTAAAVVHAMPELVPR